MTTRTRAPVWCGAHRARALVVVGVLMAAGCFDTAVESVALPRTSRFGALRDFEFYPRSVGLGGPFFLDRFETTRADWDAWLAARGAAAEKPDDDWNPGRDPALPRVGIALRDARAFARWRFGRVPRYDEWQHVATGGGRYALPWGDAVRSSWANTEELGLPGLTPVGAFESGRPAGGPYDLVGNAAEWTETPAWQRPNLVEASLATGVDPGDIVFAARRFGSHPAVRALPRVPGEPWSLGVLVGATDERVARIVVAGFTRPLAPAFEHFWSADWRTEVRFPSERSSVIGVRVASDPETMVELLTADGETLTSDEERALRSFVAKAGVRDALRTALQRHQDWLARSGQVTAVLRAELGL